MFIIVNTSTDAIVHTLFRTSNYKFYSAKFFGTYTQPCSQTRHAQPPRRTTNRNVPPPPPPSSSPYHLIFWGVWVVLLICLHVEYFTFLLILLSLERCMSRILRICKYFSPSCRSRPSGKNRMMLPLIFSLRCVDDAL